MSRMSAMAEAAQAGWSYARGESSTLLFASGLSRSSKLDERLRLDDRQGAGQRSQRRVVGQCVHAARAFAVTWRSMRSRPWHSIRRTSPPELDLNAPPRLEAELDLRFRQLRLEQVDIRLLRSEPAGVGLEEVHAQEAVVVGRLVFRRNTQPLVIRVETLGIACGRHSRSLFQPLVRPRPARSIGSPPKAFSGGPYLIRRASMFAISRLVNSSVKNHS